MIFSADLADATCTQLTKAMNNKGYFRAQVDTTMVQDKRKVNLVYNITANQPYTIRKYSVDFPHEHLQRIATNHRQIEIQEGMQFDADLLNQERQRVASAMRRDGYFYFDAEYIQFEADSTRGNKQIDITMKLQNYVETMPEEDREKMFRQYKIARVCFHIDYDPSRVPDDVQMYSTMQDGYVFTWVGKLSIPVNPPWTKTLQIRPSTNIGWYAMMFITINIKQLIKNNRFINRGLYIFLVNYFSRCKYTKFFRQKQVFARFF